MRSLFRRSGSRRQATRRIGLGARVVAQAATVVGAFLVFGGMTPSPAAAETPSESGAPAVRIVRPPPIVTGHRIFTAVAEGADVASVRFVLDGEVVAVARERPFEVGIGLGRRPRLRTLAVEARGADGRVLARDALELNTGVGRFAVALEEPESFGHEGEWLQVRASVEAPPARDVERVEIFVDDERVATWSAPPWQGRVRLDTFAPALLRAVAYLDEGAVAEDILPINVAAQDSLRVDLVELSTAVVDRRGRRVEDLGREDFRVQENGVPQRIEHVREVRNAPVHIAMVVDTSGSMSPIIKPVQATARAFLDALMTSRDRATLITFASAPTQRVAFTEELSRLGEGLEGVEAGGGTALYDALNFALEQFLGIRGQRALVLLSDGRDVLSERTPEEVFALARRAAVTIYCVGIEERGFGAPSRLDRTTLRNLARETGGRSYFVESAETLREVYAQIEEDLRSRYLITYHSSGDSVDRGFRRVDVEVPGTWFTARTIRGYYP